MDCIKFVSFLLLASLVSSDADIHSTLQKLSIKMPGAQPQKDDAYLCTSVKVDSEEKYIVHFEANATHDMAHHMLLFGCTKPGRLENIWNCGDMGGMQCEGQERILYAWAKNAPPKDMPKDVAFEIGKKTDIKYLVLQVHYAHGSKAVVSDHSGFVLHTTPQRQPYLAGIYLLWASFADIPPEKNGVHVDIGCTYDDDSPIYAFAYRTHAHRLGKVISGYKVHNKQWTLLGKGDPQAPQAFYSMKKVFKISKGDKLAARCTYDAKGHHLKKHVNIGPTGRDEMCNFYIMYYRDSNTKELRYEDCDNQYLSGTLKRFPADSDVPLKKVNGNIHTGSKKRILEDERADKEVVKDKKEEGEGFHSVHPTDSDELVKNSNQKASDQNSTSTSTTTNQPHTHAKTTATEKKLGTSSTANSVSITHEQVDASTEYINIKPTPMEERRSYRLVEDWPKLGDLRLGQVSGVALDSQGNVIVFHRGSRKWDGNSFDDQNVFISADAIDEYTVISFDRKTGKIIGKWGRNMFYLPHGLTVDHKDNVWVTDVAMHQVFKYPPKGGDKPLLVLGEELEPGSDNSHFCKPTDVAIETSGVFYVADGYCNSRVMKFSAKGNLLATWGKETRRTFGGDLPSLGMFNVPHSLALDKRHHRLYIADRENGRVQSIDTRTGEFGHEIALDEFGPLVFAVDFNSHDGGVLHVVNGQSLRGGRRVSVQGFTVKAADGTLLNTWPDHGDYFSQPHDVASSADNMDVFVTEVGPNRVWKLTRALKTHPENYVKETIKGITKNNRGHEKPAVDPESVNKIKDSKIGGSEHEGPEVIEKSHIEKPEGEVDNYFGETGEPDEGQEELLKKLPMPKDNGLDGISPDFCSLPQKTGPCRAAIPRWYYNNEKRTCVHFIYGGCQGNGNNFGTKKDCLEVCFTTDNRDHHHAGKESSTAKSSEDLLETLDNKVANSTPSERPNEQPDKQGQQQPATAKTDNINIDISHNKDTRKNQGIGGKEAEEKEQGSEAPTEHETDDWENAAGEDEGEESNLHYFNKSTSSRHNKSKTIKDDENMTTTSTIIHIKPSQGKHEDDISPGMIPALIILSVLAVPIVFLLLISIVLRVRAYRREARYKANRLLNNHKEGLAISTARGWWSYLNCCNKRKYGFDKVNLAEFYSDSDSDGV